MAPSAADVDGVLRRLRETPKRFARAAAGSRPPTADGWSLAEVLAHVRGAADVQGAWIERMLAEDAPSIRYASPRTGMKKHADDELSASLRAFTRQRASLVKTLASLALPDWSRGATFTGTKPGWTQTVFDVASGIATHEHAHFEQIAGR